MKELKQSIQKYNRLNNMQIDIKKLYFLLIIFLSTAYTTSAQFGDSLEDYDEGPLFNDRWTTWNGINDGTQNAIVTTNQAFSGTKSVYFGPGPGPQDAIVDFEEAASSGVWHATWQMYIPDGKSAYFNVQGNVDPSASANQQFIVPGTYFNENNQNPGLVDLANTNISAVFYTDVWFFMAIEVDLDNNVFTIAIGQGSGHSSVGNVPLNQGDRFAGVNFYSVDSFTEFYVDDFELVEGPWSFDTIPPVANCVAPFTIELPESGIIVIDPEDIDNGSTDNLNFLEFELDIDTFDCTMIGENEVELTVTDLAGNQDVCSTIVTIVDLLEPNLVCIPEVTIQLDENGEAVITVSDVVQEMSDNCEIDSSVLDITFFDCSFIGANTVEVTVTDGSGNSTSCTSTVIVLPFHECPENLVANTDLGECRANNVDLGTPTFSEVCLTLDNVINDAPSFFEQGETVVTWTAMYSSGLSIICQQIVTVMDTESPEVTCPQNPLMITISAGDSYEVPDYVISGVVTGIDNCDNTISVQSQIPAIGEELTGGSYTVQVIVEDDSSNSAQCEFQLVIEEILSTSDRIFNGISVFPNPVNDRINILNPNEVSIKEIELFDVLGRKVFVNRPSQVFSTKSIDLTRFAAGAYFLRITNNEGSLTKKIVKKN